MGYTHYWNQSRAFTTKEWEKIANYADRVILAATNAGISIKGSAGRGKPEITPEYVIFNGDEEGDECHESFVLSRVIQDSFNFCKTAQKPYDAAVVSILHYAHEVAPDALEISSDGGPEVFVDAYKVQPKAKKTKAKKEKPLTPDEFLGHIMSLKGKYDGDTEAFHAAADDLLCKVLRQLGYKEGIEVYKETEKWYA